MAFRQRLTDGFIGLVIGGMLGLGLGGYAWYTVRATAMAQLTDCKSQLALVSSASTRQSTAIQLLRARAAASRAVAAVDDRNFGIATDQLSEVRRLLQSAEAGNLAGADAQVQAVYAKLDLVMGTETTPQQVDAVVAALDALLDHPKVLGLMGAQPPG